jgi:hypothetical protein
MARDSEKKMENPETMSSPVQTRDHEEEGGDHAMSGHDKMGAPDSMGGHDKMSAPDSIGEKDAEKE